MTLATYDSTGGRDDPAGANVTPSNVTAASFKLPSGTGSEGSGGNSGSLSSATVARPREVGGEPDSRAIASFTPTIPPVYGPKA